MLYVVALGTARCDAMWEEKQAPTAVTLSTIRLGGWVHPLNGMIVHWQVDSLPLSHLGSLHGVIPEIQHLLLLTISYP